MRRVCGWTLALTVVLVSGVLGYIAAMPLIYFTGWVHGNETAAMAFAWAGPMLGLAAGVFWARAMIRR